MQETQVQSLGQKDPLEKKMATHSCILAWRIPWTEEPGGPQSMGSQSRTRLSDWTKKIIQLWKPFFESNVLGRLFSKAEPCFSVPIRWSDVEQGSTKMLGRKQVWWWTKKGRKRNDGINWDKVRDGGTEFSMRALKAIRRRTRGQRGDGWQQSTSKSQTSKSLKWKLGPCSSSPQIMALPPDVFKKYRDYP